MDEVSGRIIRALQESKRPLRAREIARILEADGGQSVSRREVSACLHSSEMRSLAAQDSSLQWSLQGSGGGSSEAKRGKDKMTASLAALACWHIFTTGEQERGKWVRTFLDELGSGDFSESERKAHLTWELLYLDVYAIRQCGLNRFGAEAWGEVDDLFLGEIKRWLVDVYGQTAGPETYVRLLEAQGQYMEAYNRMVRAGADGGALQDFVISAGRRVWGSEPEDFRFHILLTGYYTGIVKAAMPVMNAMELVSD